MSSGRTTHDKRQRERAKQAKQADPVSTSGDA